MKHSIIIVLIIYCFFNVTAQEKIIFELGKKDNSSSEFALSPKDYESFLANFSGESIFNVGYSDISKDWPYVLPGPLDGFAGGGYWAGYHPRHFPILMFDLKSTPNKGQSSLLLRFTGISSKTPSKIRIEINGKRYERELIGRSSDSLLKGNAIHVEPQDLRIDFANDLLKEGMNKIQMGIVSGHWALFDYIALSSRSKMELNPTTSTLIKSVEQAPFEYIRGNKRFQSILVDLKQFDRPQELSFYLDGTLVSNKNIEVGESIQEVNVPASTAKSKKISKFIVKNKSKILFDGNIELSPKRLHEYVDYVDLLVGTGNSRWMFKPSPVLPLSMVQIAPDNQDETWKAGYEYSIENVMGFSHFSDWTMIGLLMQPTVGEIKVNPGRENFPDEGYRSRIDKSSEIAKVGYYSVFMTDTRIKAELTATRRAALQRYTFPKSDSSRVLIDMFTPNEYPHNLTDAKITKVSDTEIEGYASYYNAFTGYSLQQEYTLYFVIQFNKPFKSLSGWKNETIEAVKGYIPGWNRNHEYLEGNEIFSKIGQINGKGDLGVLANFSTSDGEEIMVRTGVSLVDLQGARNNLEREIIQPFNWDFNAVVNNSRKIWNEYLGRIEIETSDYLQKKKFYTNFYRAIAAKAIWSDYDGRYRDENEHIQQLDDPEDVIISGEYWNTFWDNQILFNLVAPEISSAWAKSAISLYKNSGWFNTDPAGIEHTGVMVAMHVISQIQGAWQSGIRDFDLKTAYRGLKKMMTVDPQKYTGGGTVGVEHLPAYIKYGYIPAGKGYVSNTLEYAYDDWSLSQMAKSLGNTEDYLFFKNRSQNWKNIFDRTIGFMRPKDEQGKWIEPFDPYHTPGFVEGNSFNYSWFVPHQPLELVDGIGKEKFVNRLNDAMEKSAKANFNAAGDNFSLFPVNHGNQTSMEVSYLFNWADAPWLTQKWNRAIQEQYYGTSPYNAYPGDEDLGQMSSWFVMSALGLFQLDGGVTEIPTYELGSPRYEKITIDLGNKYGRGAKFTIYARNASKVNKYIQHVTLNGKTVDSYLIPQSEILKGGEMIIEMGDQPNKLWGIK
ncbi:GH92 family glycosyl hydrolase [Sphingobacterium endophyticum]|uniref:GH92 family glycosyl hydrolase n=1 Tax=Sphingobacterium endophyticum TaxID=2546448 RepID=UPI0012E21813|nr:GH92 family glycosyl hydrolase [Sphingobacterium endophyticum]